MSTILNALKKLEKDQGSKQPDQYDWSKDFNTRQVVNRMVRSSWLKSIAIRCVALTLLVFAIIVTLVVYFKSDKPLPAIKADATLNAVEPKISDNNKLMDNAWVDNRLPDEKQSINNKVNELSMNHDMDKKKNSDVSKNSFPDLNYVENTEAINQYKATQNTYESELGKQVGVKNQSSLFPFAKLFSDSRFRIHAIAWSADADRRIAVINSNIVREGNKVLDYTLISIGKDEVYFKDREGGIWKMQFGRK
ncbi:MAG: hypothetical protein GY874_23955 [Desulfobacteraceae bacterium]|nr:hypothetical protein [Desulfobacteraceae bacterium]